MPDPTTMSIPEWDDATQLALERNRLAYERTLLAWVRTSIAMISFGFTVYKLFQYLHDSGETRPRERLIGPREFGMAMICLGLVALVLAVIEHRRNLRLLRIHYGKGRLSMAGVFAAFVACLGLLGFFAILFRH
jgi:putative membrane protein